MILYLKVNEVDDEYRWAGTKDPKVVLTTSRDPSSKLKMFSKVFLPLQSLYIRYGERNNCVFFSGTNSKM